MTDQHRGDCIGHAGNPAIKTPNIDALAAEGVMFQKAYTSTPSCTPARAALLTGWSPWHHGMLGYGRVAPSYRFEMPRMLRDLGYHTIGIGKMHWHPQRALHGFHETILDESGRVDSPGFTSDYRKWFREVAPGKDPDATGIGWNANTWGDYALEEHLHPTAWTGDKAVVKIRAHDPSTPLFLKVSFARPHSPYDAPARLAALYDWRDMPDPVIGDWCKANRKVLVPRAPASGDFGVEHAKRARRHYCASITFIDEQVGRIIAALKEHGMLDDALVLFTADHGDMLGDHHLWRKTYPYEGSTRIPMVLRWPGSFEAAVPRGSVLDHPIELRDVLPTFLDAAGGIIPAAMDGASMLDLVRGNASGWRSFIDLEHATTYFKENHWVGLTDGKVKYVFFRPTGREQLFDLERDPGEQHDLAGDAAWHDVLAAWRGRLVSHLQPRGTGWVHRGKLKKAARPVLYSPCFPRKRP